jgi:hypothetical protein
LPLWADDSTAGDLLKSLSVARAQGGTVLKVTPQRWSLLSEFGDTVAAESPLDAEARLVRSAFGQGFGLSKAERDAVEKRAIALAAEYFVSCKWDLRDVSNYHSFDLECMRGREIIRVEMKGTTSSGEEIVLTKNEVELARQPGYALLVVAEIELDRTGAEPVARGGISRLYHPWSPREDDLKAISFRCALDLNAGKII